VRRKARVTTRITSAQLTAWQAAADRVGLSLSAWLARAGDDRAAGGAMRQLPIREATGDADTGVGVDDPGDPDDPEPDRRDRPVDERNLEPVAVEAAPSPGPDDDPATDQRTDPRTGRQRRGRTDPTDPAEVADQWASLRIERRADGYLYRVGEPARLSFQPPEAVRLTCPAAPDLMPDPPAGLAGDVDADDLPWNDGGRRPDQ